MSFDPLAIACEVSSAAELGARILGSLAAHVGFDVAFFSARGAPAVSVGLDAAGLHDRLNTALSPGSRYERELLPVKRAALAARGVAVDTDVLGPSRVREAAYFRHFARPLGGKHSLMGYFVLRGQVIGGLMLGRTGGPFRPRDVELVEGLLPAMTVARASFGLPGLVSGPLAPREGAHRWPWSSGVLARRTTARAEIVVRDRRGFREMVARSAVTGKEMIWSRASLADPSRSGWPYLDLFHVAAALAGHRERALFIGCGAGVAPRQFAATYPGIGIDVVESEPRVVELAAELFALEEIPHTRVHVADGVSFVKSSEAATWDVVLVDAYDGDDLAEGLASRAFFAAVGRALRPAGTMAFNVIGSLDGKGAVSTVVGAASAELHDIRIVPVMGGEEAYDPGALRNVVVIGAKPR